MDAIIVQNISKSHGAIHALRNVSFSVRKGEVFGLIGADGAGKSTLFHILATLTFADAGTASVEGFDTAKDYQNIRNVIGYMPGRFSLYQDLSVQENLEFFATIFGGSLRQNYEMIRNIYTQIEPFKHRRAGQLSGGMKQKLALCCTLVHQPKVLFLDEPTTGVDPVSRQEFWEILTHLKRWNITILVSTPYMDEANLCERVALLQEGRILAIDSPKQLTERFSKRLLSVRSSHIHRALTDLRQHPAAHSCHAFGQRVHVALADETVSESDIVAYLSERGHNDIEVTLMSASIEDCFMELMQRSE